MEQVWIAFGLTVFAGMATGIGSLLAFAAKRTNYRFLAISTGFSAGVMLYISFVEIFFKGAESLVVRYGDNVGNWVNVASFFGGMAVIGLIDNLIPAEENPHEPHPDEELAEMQDRGAPLAGPVAASTTAAGATPAAHDHDAGHRHLMRTGLFTALAVGIHNFPEGLATFLAALQDPALGVAIAVAVALHNIPEGISVSIPIFYATGSRRKAFIYSALSGVSEPVGAAVAYLVIRLFVGGGADV
ncbi:MAG: zinc transporter ZupT, partial [Anaerolineae bacterium]|nr:zinc transporter ZupT [Anaerolineae bacterium]